MTSELEKDRVYLEEARAFFNFSNEVRRRIDDKIHNMLVLSGILITILFGLGYFLIQQEVVRMPYTFWLLMLSALSYFATMIIGLIFYRPLNVATRNIRKVIQKYEKSEADYPPSAPIQHIAWNLSLDAEMNQKIVTRKAYWLKIMLLLFTLGIVFLIIALGLLMCIP